MSDHLPVVSENDDMALMVRTAGGDRDAFAGLYDRHGGLMLALGMRILGERLEAEDVLQDVFVEVWRRAGDYDPSRGSVRAWLALRMRSRSLDRVRSASRRRAVSEPEGAATLVSSDDPFARVDASRVHAALGKLNQEQREVLELGYFEGLSSTEIATRLALPVGTVKSRVRVAMQQLRARLHPEGGRA